MAKKIVITKGGAAPATSKQPPAKGVRKPAPVRRTSGSSGGDDGVSPKLIVGLVIGGIVLILLIVAAASSGPKKQAVAQTKKPVGGDTKGPTPTKMRELGGKTMAEWISDNHIEDNNAALQERKQRLRQQTGASR